MPEFDNSTSIICITTEGSDHRIDNFIDQCSSYRIENYKIAKFKPYQESNFTLTGRYISNIHENSKGPTTSHLLTIKNWLESSEDQYVLIMEDDISLETINYWNFNFSEFVESLPQDWECVQLSCIRESFDNLEIKTRLRLNSDWGCQAYLIKREYAKKLISKYYISDTHFNLDNFNAKIQVSPGEYTTYDLFPIVENILFEGAGVVYNMPLFIEDINTNTSFSQSNDQIHISSYNHILSWWKNEGYKKEVLEINNHTYKDPITVVQLGSHRGYDNLSKYLLRNYKELKFGLFVEANPEHIDELKGCYKRYENVIIENIAIKPKDSIEDFLEIFYHDKDPDKQVASYDINHVKKHEYCWNSGEIHSFKVDALSIENLLDKYKLKDIDWLLIDIEGLEPDILMNLDLDKYSIKRIEFEKLHIGSNMSKILTKLASFGYRRVESLHEYDWAFELTDDSSTDTLTQFTLNTEDDQLNFNLAYEYEKVGHTASAFSHYLRCAERTQDINLSYECLIRGYYCFNSQGGRDFTSTHLLKHAITLLPKRPEAYFLLSKHYERYHQWYECYTYSSIASEICEFNNVPLKIDIEYSGKESLLLCKAIGANSWDKIDESRSLLNSIIDSDHKLTNDQLASVEYHLTEIEKKKQKHLKYHKDQYSRLKIKFDGSQDIEENYSQAYQDLFVLSATDGKRNGKYLEIGAGDPHFGNNTYLLEKKYGWQGLSIEINSNLVSKFQSNRSNKIIQGDATKLNYRAILDELNIGADFDYLQLDCEPPAKTFETLLSIPFDKYRFSIITYEHDYYLDMTRSYRQKSRNYLQSLGYKLLIGNVSMDESTPFEDWWIHPDLIDYSKFAPLYSNSIKNIEKHILN